MWWPLHKLDLALVERGEFLDFLYESILTKQRNSLLSFFACCFRTNTLQTTARCGILQHSLALISLQISLTLLIPRPLLIGPPTTTSRHADRMKTLLSLIQGVFDSILCHQGSSYYMLGGDIALLRVAQQRLDAQVVLLEDLD